jgi:hypothetical protein
MAGMPNSKSTDVFGASAGVGRLVVPNPKSSTWVVDGPAGPVP